MDDATGLLTPRRYRSGAIVIDPVQRQVVVDGEPARLGARAFDLLLVLLERRDRVVGKRELLDLVWPRLVVEENNLQVHVAALRKVLGPQAIATIPGRGYQFALAIDALEPVVPPAATAAAVAFASGRDPGNLPATAPLIGRAADIAAVDALLRDHRALTLAGAGGIGKTRLALAVAQAAASGRFPDGRWWIDMAALTSGDQMRQAIASTLGAAPVVARSDAALADAVAPLNALVVLDNCEHLVDVLAPLLDMMLAHAPGPRWLATSQESLKCSGEQVYRLGGLTVPEALDLDAAAETGAVALFVERVHALDPRFRLGTDNLAPVVEICRRLDGIPLAIEFAAARVPLLGARGVAERLDQRLDLLSGGSRMRLRRHQTLRAALEWSYGLLSDDEKRVFRCLGAFTGGFTLELAQSLAQDDRTDEWQVLDLLSRLIDRSLVIAEGDDRPRYSLLETTRAFALEMLAENGESATVLRRHAEVMRDFARAFESAMRRGEVPPQSSARELGNLRAAMNWSSADPASRPLACELHAAAWPLFQRSGCNAEFTTRMLALFPLPPGLPRELEAACLFAVGRLSPMIEPDVCWEAAQRAVVLYRDLGDPERLADALTQLSVFAHHRQQPETAREALAEAERLTGDSSAYYMQCRLAYARGLRAGAAGDRGAQLASFAKLAELGRSRGDAFNELVGLGNIGSVELDSGDLDAAVAMLTRVVARFRELQLPNSMGCALSELSLALALRGDDVDVLGMAREAHAKARLAGVESSNAALLAAAVHHLGRGDAPRAALLVGRAEAALSGVPARPRPFEMSLVPQLLDRCRGVLPPAHLERARQRGASFSARRAAGIAFDAAPVEAVAA